MTTKKSTKNNYENNPFFVPIQGATLLFELARGVTVVLIILSVLSSFSRGNNQTSDDPKEMLDVAISTMLGWSAEQWFMMIGAGLVIGLAWLLVMSLFGGVASYTSAQLSKGHRVDLRKAFRVAFDNLWPFVWLQILVFVKVVLWSLLFIVPGIIMAFRYSLAGVAFYDEGKKLRGEAAIKESIKLTKNGWMTTFASNLLLNFVTLGVLGSLISTAVNTTLYKQFSDVGDKKPAAHWLSVTISVIMMAVIVLGLFGLFIYAI